MIGLTRAAALDYAAQNLRINAVCPSFADTPMVAGTVLASGVPRAEAVAKLTGGIPLGRLATPAEIVQAILFAAAPENSFMTGQALAVDGGLSAI